MAELLLPAIIILLLYWLAKRLFGSSSRKDDETDIDDEDYEIVVRFRVVEEQSYGDRDAWEGSFWDAADPRNVDVTLELDYKDANGKSTTRVVQVRRFDPDLHNGLLIGHCELRDATRTFRFDRIKKCVDVDTGEVVKDVQAHLNALYEASPDRVIDSLMNDYLDVAKVLFYIAKADGQYRKEEKAVVTEYLRKLLRDDRITSELVDQGLRTIDVPSMQSFKLALGRVVNGGEVSPKELQRCCHDIVTTQKAVHPNEQAALDYIDKRFAVG